MTLVGGLAIPFCGFRIVCVCFVRQSDTILGDRVPVVSYWSQDFQRCREVSAFVRGKSIPKRCGKKATNDADWDLVPIHEVCQVITLWVIGD